MQGPSVPRGNEILLHAITEANVDFADGRDKDFLFPKFLQHCVDLTESRFGLIGELIGPPDGPSVFHIISFNTQHATQHSTTTLELTSQITDAITSRTPCITNSLTDQDLPSNFPSIHSFIGIPLFHRDDLIGMLGLADNPAGYDIPLATFLRPFSTTCSSLMVGYRKQEEQQRVLHMLENAKIEAEQSALAKAHFLSNMSHEIRTPLNGIIGLTSLVLDSPLTFDQREMVETVQSSGDLLLSVVNDLAKFEAGKLGLHEVHFDIRACVEACIDVVAIGAERKGIEVLSAVAEGVPATMLGDYDRVRQILTNLVGNAVKFTERGEVMVGVRIDNAQIMTLQKSFSGNELSTAILKEESEKEEESKGSKVVHFWVRDTGIGIPKDKQDLLFKMYNQIDPYRTNGTGLGLAICKRLVEAMSGKIWATSEQGVGSCFHFAIPATTSKDATPYYPPIKGKTLTIFSHLESHARVLQDFARQHTMTATTHVLGSDLLTPAQLQSLHNSSAVIINVLHADRIVAQLERYFREGRASPQTPTHTSPSASTPTLDVRGLWAGSSLTTATSFAPPHATSLLPLIPPLMLPKATLRVTQIAPLLTTLAHVAPSELATPPPSSLPHPFGLIPPPILPATTGTVTASITTPDPQTVSSATATTSTNTPTRSPVKPQPPTTTATLATTPTKLKQPAAQGSISKPSRAPTHPTKPTQDSQPSKIPIQRRRGRSMPSPREQSPKVRRNTSPTKGKYLSMFTATTGAQTTSSADRPLIPSPKESKTTKPPAKPILSAKLPATPGRKNAPRSTSAPKPMPPTRSPEITPPGTPKKKGMQQSKSAYAIAYINATQLSSPPSDTPLSAREPIAGSSSKQPPIPALKIPPISPKHSTNNGQKQSPQGSAQTPQGSTQTPQVSTQTPQGSTQTTPPLSSTQTSQTPTSNLNSPSSISQTTISPTTSSTSHHANLRVITTTGSSSNSNSSTTPLQSPLAIGSLQQSSSTSSYGSSDGSGSGSNIPSSPSFTPPSSTPSTPASPVIPCPVLIFVPMSSPPPRTTCANIFFLPKPIKFSRLSRKLDTIFENAQSPSTPSRIDRPRYASGSRLSAGEDFALDPSMAVMHPLTIMVGEDNLVGQVVTQRMLSKLGYTAEFYGSGDALLASLENRVFDVILLDLKMPGCDGFECARRICSALPPGHRPHIAAVTANILASDRDMAAAVGFNDYITKPFLLPDLARVLVRCKKLDLLHTLPFKSFPSTPPTPSSSSASPSSSSSSSSTSSPQM